MGFGIGSALLGCQLAADEVGQADDAINGGVDAPTALRSTVLLDQGCFATKVGPRHFLLTARCAVGARFAPGTTFGFRPATDAPPAEPLDAGAPDPVDADTATDGAASATAIVSATVAQVTIHPSFESTCARASACALGATGASDVADIAVVVVDRDLPGLPTVPVDLDPVGEADALLVVSSGCAAYDRPATSRVIATRTIALPPRVVNHAGSPYADAPELLTPLFASYVVTGASGWQAGAPRFCQRDVGAPVFRTHAAAITGLFSNYTTWADHASALVTAHHARVDARSRYNVGAWLTTLGVQTIHSCSESLTGCPTQRYDGGRPTEPVIVEGPDEDAATRIGPIPDGERQVIPSPRTGVTADGEIGDAAVPVKKKTAAACSAIPGETNATVLPLALGALAATLFRRRRRDVARATLTRERRGG